MPRGIGASTGVNDSVTGAPASRPRFCRISGVCWWLADLVRRQVAHHLAAEQPGRGGPARPAGAAGGRRRRGRTARRARRPAAGASASVMAVGVAAGAGDPPGTGQLGAEQLRQAVRPAARRTACRRSAPSPRRSASRWSAPRSTTGRSAGSAAASAADWPCGRARKTTSASASRGRVGGDERPVDELRQAGVHVGHRRAGAAAGGDRPELEVGMGEQQAEQLAARVPAGAGDCCCQDHPVTIHTAA